MKGIIEIFFDFFILFLSAAFKKRAGQYFLNR